MHKSILVLEESQMVHDLFESALPKEYWDWRIEHELMEIRIVPGRMLDRVVDVLGRVILQGDDRRAEHADAVRL